MGMDSPEILSVAMDQEECYDLFIPDEDVEKFTTIQNEVSHLEEAVAERLTEIQELCDPDNDKSQ